MVHVLIERYIAEGMISTYEELARKAMHRSYVAPGFISGESFIDAHAPHRRLLLCKWRSERDWLLWSTSDLRTEFTNQIAPILEEPERVIVLHH